MNDAMKRAGWRECPSDDVRRKWEGMGGRWAISARYEHMPCIGYYSKPEVVGPNASESDGALMRGLWRPVHPDHGWDHATWMWATCTGESLVPTEPGWYWWRLMDDHPWHAMRVGMHRNKLIARIDTGYFFDAMHIVGEEGVNNGQWGGPVTGMPPENFKEQETKR